MSLQQVLREYFGSAPRYNDLDEYYPGYRQLKWYVHYPKERPSDIVQYLNQRGYSKVQVWYVGWKGLDVLPELGIGKIIVRVPLNYKEI